MSKASKFKLPPEAKHRWVTLYVRDKVIPEGRPVARRGYSVSDDDVRPTQRASRRLKTAKRIPRKRRA